MAVMRIHSTDGVTHAGAFVVGFNMKFVLGLGSG
jgi:hypothetical protein